MDRDRDPRLDERDRPRRGLGVEMAGAERRCPSPRSASARRRPRRAAPRISSSRSVSPANHTSSIRKPSASCSASAGPGAGVRRARRGRRARSRRRAPACRPPRTSRTVPNGDPVEVAASCPRGTTAVVSGEASRAQRRPVEVVVVQVREQHDVDRPGVGRVGHVAAQVRDAAAQHGVGDHARAPASRSGRWRGRAT